MITSRSEDVIDENDTITKIDYVGASRVEIELRHNSHDVFLSTEEPNVNMAINFVNVWMNSNEFE